MLIDLDDIVLGERYKDKITGFEGICTGKYEFMYGCHRVNLQGVINGEPKDFVFDVPQVEHVPEQGVVVEPAAVRRHGPRPSPSRTGL
jgi:hypothetical protein